MGRRLPRELDSRSRTAQLPRSELSSSLAHTPRPLGYCGAGKCRLPRSLENQRGGKRVTSDPRATGEEGGGLLSLKRHTRIDPSQARATKRLSRKRDALGHGVNSTKVNQVHDHRLVG